MTTKKIKLMTYNIGFSAGLDGLLGAIHSKFKIIKNLEAISRCVNRYQPDILAVQEIDIKSKRSCFINEVDYIKTACKFPYIAIAITWNCFYVPYPISFNFKTHFGRTKAANVIFSKYPLIENKTLFFSKPKNNPWWYNLFYLNRLTQFVTVQHPSGQYFDIINIQLDAFHSQERNTQLSQILSRLKTLKNPHILCGDMNSVPEFQKKKAPFIDEHEIDYSSTVMKTLSKQYKITPHYNTYPSHSPNRQLDYILASERLNRSSLNIASVDGYPSDHLPLIADIILLE
jgi:endonuclease/exonuclease/phosphatase family metal-dependent hydrolase